MMTQSEKEEAVRSLFIKLANATNDDLSDIISISSSLILTSIYLAYKSDANKTMEVWKHISEYIIENFDPEKHIIKGNIPIIH